MTVMVPSSSSTRVNSPRSSPVPPSLDLRYLISSVECLPWLGDCIGHAQALRALWEEPRQDCRSPKKMVKLRGFFLFHGPVVDAAFAE